MIAGPLWRCGEVCGRGRRVGGCWGVWCFRWGWG